VRLAGPHARPTPRGPIFLWTPGPREGNRLALTSRGLVRQRQLGKDGPLVSELTLGTWGLSGDAYGKLLDSEVDRVIDRAVAAGITLFDTADAWGKGAMQTKLGERLPSGITHVAAKLGTDLDVTPPKRRFDAAFLRAALDKTQERLRRSCVDVLLLHNPSAEALEKSDAIPFLREAREKGHCATWGVSAGSVAIAEKALELDAPVLELAYNVYLAGDLQRLAKSIGEKGTGVLARSVLAHGLLCGYWTAERDFYPGDHRAERWSHDELRFRIGQLDALRPVVGGGIPTLRAAALRFVLQSNLVSSAVLGPRSPAQLDQLVREAGVGPPYISVVLVRDLMRRLKSNGCAIEEVLR
jgi:aryl-alcohol dehydrogenase-like predicted oxidoreductase